MAHETTELPGQGVPGQSLTKCEDEAVRLRTGHTRAHRSPPPPPPTPRDLMGRAATCKEQRKDTPLRVGESYPEGPFLLRTGREGPVGWTGLTQEAHLNGGYIPLTPTSRVPAEAASRCSHAQLSTSTSSHLKHSSSPGRHSHLSEPARSLEHVSPSSSRGLERTAQPPQVPDHEPQTPRRGNSAPSGARRRCMWGAGRVGGSPGRPELPLSTEIKDAALEAPSMCPPLSAEQLTRAAENMQHVCSLHI